jgi:hypothetical protein
MGMKLDGFLLTIQDQRVEPTDDPVVLFRETPAGVARAVREWFYPGETIGYEFVYPKDQAVKIAKQTHERVLSSEETIDKADREHLHGAKVGRVDENGHFTSTSEEPAATSGSTSDTSKSKSTDK